MSDSTGIITVLKNAITVGGKDTLFIGAFLPYRYNR